MQRANITGNDRGAEQDTGSKPQTGVLGPHLRPHHFLAARVMASHSTSDTPHRRQNDGGDTVPRRQMAVQLLKCLVILKSRQA